MRLALAAKLVRFYEMPVLAIRILPIPCFHNTNHHVGMPLVCNRLRVALLRGSLFAPCFRTKPFVRFML